jgi:hypothetical protein
MTPIGHSGSQLSQPEVSTIINQHNDDGHGPPSATTTNSASGAVQADNVESAGLPEFLTPQSLVAYCDCRLTSLDSQMQQIFNQQQTNASATTAINQVASDLDDLPGPSSGSNPTIPITGVEAGKIQADYQAAIKAAATGGSGSAQLVSSLKQDLVTFQNACDPGIETAANHDDVNVDFTCDGHSGDTYNVSSNTISGLTQNLKTDGSDLNNDSQMTMINLQSLMSQQQTAVELSTNLLQTESQTAQNIASNLKAS